MDFRAAICSNPRILEALRQGGEHVPRQPILTAKVKLLWGCNLSCRFCRLPDSTAVMSRATVLALGRELAAEGLRKVHFSGGEVLLHPDCFAIFADWAGLGIQVNLTSNGLMMGKEETKLLEDSGVHTVSLSIDSGERKIHDELRGRKGSHKAVVRAAERLVMRGRIKLRVNTVVTSRNIKRIPAMRELIQGLGPNVAWKLIPVDPVEPGLAPSIRAVERLAEEARGWEELEDKEPFGNTPAHYGEIAAGRHGFRDGRCYAPWFHLFFSPDGSCHPCCMARGMSAPLGKYPEEPVSTILEGEHLRAVRSLLASGGRLEACARCDDFLAEGAIIDELITGAEDT